MNHDYTVSIPAHPPGSLPKGTVIAGRFSLESLEGRGGMGFVYRASDSSTGQPVALKLLSTVTSPESAHRFNREAVLLAGMRHPGIVSYVAHGTTAESQPYLAMEWLEGEDLSRRLARKPLDVSETLALLRRVADALVTAHQRGIVHRDLKPSNLFLRGRRPEDVVLLDFGLARYVAHSLEGVTGAGTVLGTPGYMAPEQASSAQEVPPAADIFSLGCVLYECLTGQCPFRAPHLAATLAKILFAEPAPLRTVRPGLHPGLQVLVDRMLAKDPRRRLSDAASLREALRAMESTPELTLSCPRPAEDVPSLAGAEQQLVSILLVSLPVIASAEESPDPAWRTALRDSLRTMLAPQKARVEFLADGSLVAALVPDRDTATDQAALAARCALTFMERWPDAVVVLTTGLGVFDERLPLGEALDRAGRLLRQFERTTPATRLLLDDVTAGLLGPGFQLSRVDSGCFMLQGEQLGADASRPLLGKPTPCVGREHELALLDLTFSACAEELAARAVLVTAPAGVGKSRLRREFLRRLERREQPPLVLLGRGDAMSTGSAYGLLGQALRKLCGVGEGESLESRRARLYQRVALHLPEAQAQDAVEFLGELCAIPFPEEDSPRLRAARGAPHLMSAQLGRALATFLSAECAHQPVLLMLEDLHWSDALTVTLVDGLLRDLAEQPFMVLALARPEVKDLFPGLWAKRLQEVPLHGLSRKACTRLVREVLGPQVPESVVRHAVEQSDGNALFLEELIRMAAEGRGEIAPETVLAVLQSRLMRMDPGARQVLLAASIFGRTFWSGGVGALLGSRTELVLLEQHLRLLVEQEVIEPVPDSRFPTENEYRFRHELVREAAYGLVPESHRPLGHQLVGDWLVRMDEPDALVLAAHFQWGRQLERAVECYIRAAERLFERNDLQGTTWCVESALACGASGEALDRLRALQAMVLAWRAQLSRGVELGLPALSGLKPGSPLWCRLISSVIVGSYDPSHPEVADGLIELLVHTTPEPDAVEAYIEAAALVGTAFVSFRERRKTAALLGRLMEVGADVMPHSPLAREVVSLLEGILLYYFDARPWRSARLVEGEQREVGAVGSERNSIMLRVLGGMTRAAMGELPVARAMLRDAVATASRMEQQLVHAGALFHLNMVLADSPEQEDRQEAHAWAFELVRGERAAVLPSAYSYQAGLSRAVLARMTAAGGALLDAEFQARRACEELGPFPVYRVYARTVLGSILRAQGRAAEAREVADLGVQELERMGCEGVHAVAMHLELAEACFAQGDAKAGDAALRTAVRCVRARAEDIPEPEARERFLRQVPENARTLELARERWGEGARGEV